MKIHTLILGAGGRRFKTYRSDHYPRDFSPRINSRDARAFASPVQIQPTSQAAPAVSAINESWGSRCPESLGDLGSALRKMPAIPAIDRLRLGFNGAMRQQGIIDIATDDA